jgi:hypothetical protein
MTTDKTLCKQLAEAGGAGASPLVPEIFSALVNDEEARMLLFASPPATAEELAAKSGLSLADVEAMMDSLFHRGLIFKATRGGEKKFYRVKNIPQMHDSTTLTPGISRGVLDLWKRYMETEWPEYGQMIMDLLPGSIMRVLPVNEGIEPQSQVLPYEDVVKVIEGAKTLSVTNCSCRVIDGACGKPWRFACRLTVRRVQHRAGYGACPFQGGGPGDPQKCEEEDWFTPWTTDRLSAM